ncbi:SMC family ATPase [Tumidithrix helvetica PCC 7403]|uniref:AAA family ATPase n=1 Tax=Tumidithrix helvetica TaxID=3457545 RepID=UPI003CBAA836
MIPQKLRIKNFLSYQQLTLDFSGLHTACICGANGSGKSSLLEAIAWAIWGESRAETEDDIIHIGTKETQVDFVFTSSGETYRVIRTRARGSASVLEFQIKSEGQFKSLTERGLRATQQVVLSHLKMDYDTFINSAYLRQGRADEFMLKRPSDRKQILAEMLCLSQYDYLAERAKDISRTCKGEATALESYLAHIKQQILAGEAIAPQLETLKIELANWQLSYEQDRAQLQLLETQQQQQQNLSQQCHWKRQQKAQIQTEIERLQQQIATQQQQLKTLTALLDRQEAIAQAYANYQQLCQQETLLNQKLQQHQKALSQQTTLNHQLTNQKSELKGQLRHNQAQLESLLQQQQELQNILNRAADIEAAHAQLLEARTNLQRIEKLQAESSPLLQRRQVLQRKIDRDAAKLTARVEEFKRSRQQFQTQHQQSLQIAETAQKLEQQIVALQKKQVYQQRVHDKGLERRDFLERLKTRLADCEQKFERLHSKMSQLAEPNAPCPLCDRPLDEANWTLVQRRHSQESKEIQAEMWLIKEQQSASDWEIKVLREEYRQLNVDLSPLPQLLQQKGTLQAQLQAGLEAQQKGLHLEQEIAKLKLRLETNDYCRESQKELEIVEHSLVRLNYDEKNLALARGEADRWRWADVKMAELKNARRQAENLAQKIPELQTSIQQLQDRLDRNLIDLKLQHQLEQCDRALAQIAYDPNHHQQIRAQKEESTPALLRYQELTQAQQQYPSLQQQFQQFLKLESDRRQELQHLHLEIGELENQLSQFSDRYDMEIPILKAKLQQARSQMDDLIGQIGSLQQAQQQVIQLIEQEKETIAKLEKIRYRQRLHQELQLAFGKNGIQALMLETVLPQIEAEANQILAQLSDHQLNVRFITQKAGKKADKVIETLEIEIADSRGTRPYETYSGGESFRINFSIRLALSRVLAQRKGSSLQTLIIDEGFGSQDRDGCDRLVAAINAIAPDFECILVITHMPQLKEAFNTLIEVTKTESGSVITLVG